MRTLTGLFLLVAVTIAFSGTSDKEVVLPTLRGSTGETLIAQCKSVEHVHLDTMKADSAADLERTSACLGYLAGVIDQRAILSVGIKEVPNFCIPDSVTGAQLTKVIVRYGDEHPEELHYPAVVLINLAILKAFPCS